MRQPLGGSQGCARLRQQRRGSHRQNRDFLEAEEELRKVRPKHDQQPAHETDQWANEARQRNKAEHTVRNRHNKRQEHRQDDPLGKRLIRQRRSHFQRALLNFARPVAG